MRKITSNWEELNTPELSTIAEPLVRSSRVYYDNIEDPTKTANDIKNMKREGRDVNKG